MIPIVSEPEILAYIFPRIISQFPEAGVGIGGFYGRMTCYHVTFSQYCRMPAYATTGAARLPSLIRSAPTHGFKTADYTQSFFDLRQFLFHVVGTKARRPHGHEDVFVVRSRVCTSYLLTNTIFPPNAQVGMADPTVVDTSVPGLYMLLQEASNIGVPLGNVIIMCRRGHCEWVFGAHSRTRGG